MRRGKEGVMEAFKALQKALEEEQERLNDPAVAQLFRILGNERLRLVEWMIGEVQKLAEIWREGKEPVQKERLRKGLQIPKGQRKKAQRVFGGMPMSAFRPYILKALVELGGRAREAEVLACVEEMVKPNLSPIDLEWLPVGNDYRWRKKARWERFNMKREGLLRSDSSRGIWELSERGWEEAKKLLEQ